MSHKVKNILYTAFKRVSKAVLMLVFYLFSTFTIGTGSFLFSLNVLITK